jgi:hypothetical protein
MNVRIDLPAEGDNIIRENTTIFWDVAPVVRQKFTDVWEEVLPPSLGPLLKR